MSEKICAGIVLYNPDIGRLKENLDSIVHNVNAIFLQDNGSTNISDVKKLLENYEEIIVLDNSVNMGIAWALNRLCEKALNEGYGWILTLDQDSVCPNNIIQEYEKHMYEADMLCPCVIDRNYGLLDKTQESITILKRCITSGCLLKLSSWKEIEGFDENMFIDGVDFEFCDRLNRAGMVIMRLNNVVLCHEIGNITLHYFLCFPVIVKNHVAFRKYYIARNIIYIARKRKSIPLIIKGILQELKLIAIVILYEKDKKNKVYHIVKGMKDGFKIHLNVY